ncbi:MAG: hypothetical protein II809_00050 [Bacteroidales bacterium]|nr:hypothetical protein [Bacteroidales bacterium]
MKKSIFAIAAVLLFAACAKESPSSITSDSEDLVFYASVETPTKAVLNTTTYALEWASEDEIAIVDNEGVKVIYVATPDGEDASKATFTKKAGEVKSLGDGPYTAYYPASISEGLPNVTVYSNGDDSDLKSLPMAAHSETTSLEFKNLCSIIKLTLSAQSGYNFKSVTLSSESKFMSGRFLISDNKAVLTSGRHYTTLNRANAKSMSVDQVYYLPIPAGTYDDLQIMVYNNVKGEQSFYLNKTRSFVRNTIYPLTLNCTDFRENLSRNRTFDAQGDPDDRYLIRSTANCYQATSAAGHYKFLPTKGEGGELVTGIKSAKVLWEAQAGTTAPTVGTIVNATVEYNKGYIEFNAGGSQGNAVIAAYDGENGTGNILWSWHIWRANVAFADETYPHGEIMMDRNVGTFNNNRNTTNAVGVYFQYGRKDPFPGRGTTDNKGNDLAAQAGTARTTAAGPVDIATSIKNPTVFYTNSSGNNWCTDADLASAVWDGESKTIYDPCPAGYRVPARSVWTTDGSTIGSFVNEFATYRGCTYDGKIYAATGQVGKGDGTMNSGLTITFMWTRELNASKNAYILDMRNVGSAKFTGYARAQAIGLRCQKVE